MKALPWRIKLDIGEMISGCFVTYGHNFARYFALFLLDQGAISSTWIAASLAIYGSPLPAPVLQPSQTPQDLPFLISEVVKLLEFVWLAAIASIIIGSIFTAVAVQFTFGTITHGKASLVDSFSKIRKKIPTIVASTLLVSLIVVAGFMLFVVPGIILGVMLSLYLPPILIEDAKTVESLGRSRDLTRGNRWSIFAIFLLLSLLLILIVVFLSIFVAVLALNVPFGLAPTQDTFLLVMQLLLSSVISATVAPLFPIVMTLMYEFLVRPPPPISPPPWLP